MTGTGFERLAFMLEVPVDLLASLDRAMTKRVGRTAVLEKVTDENDLIVTRTLKTLDVKNYKDPKEIRATLKNAIIDNEQQLLTYVGAQAGKNEFEKAAVLARKIARVGKGFFLKREYGADILRKCTPHELLKFLGYKDVEELLTHHNIEEIFSALRFIESDEWMHQTFEAAYSRFTPADFEEREIDIKVLGPEWREVALKFVAKKHHNVSHLKEFGVIFLNPISENVPGKFVRDFALILHYFHEIEFYSKLFRRYAAGADFSENLKSLLRGDVPETKSVGEGEWLIVQRYLWKIDPKDPRLFLPRVNPESMFWFRGERDIVELGEAEKNMKLAMWHDLDWVGLELFDGDGLISFDLEDNAMTEVSAREGKAEYFNYHQREALWTKIFSEYVGGEFEMERLLVENFHKGKIAFGESNHTSL